MLYDYCALLIEVMWNVQLLMSQHNQKWRQCKEL